MSNFTESYDPRTLKGQVDTFLEGVHKLAKMGQRMTLSQRDAGEVLVLLMTPILDELVTRLRRSGGEAAETTCANYWAAKAVVYGMVGKQNEGRAFLAQSRSIRTGGPWQEWCQTYYK